MDRLDVETLRRTAQLAGFELSPTDLEPIRPAIERALEALAQLEELPLADVEPGSRFGVV
jgi:Asp-tRNA(Asn)/Glu-tRNA(Gln) amidotransferase C subunit